MVENVRKKVTLADVARESGVSQATVSLALRNKPGVGEETREQVLQVAYRLGYPVDDVRPDPQLEGVHHIGLVLKVRPDDDLQSNYFYAPVLAGIEAFCRQRQINLFYAHMAVDEDNNPIEPPRLLKEQETAGLLVVGALLDGAAIRMIERQQMPVVLVDAYATEGDYDAVVSDNEQGAYEAASYLIDQGHRHIGIVGSLPDSYPSIRERRNGYLRALAEHDLTPNLANCHHHPDVAVPAATAFLESHPHVTALFVCNDEVAIGVMQAAQSLGRKVPEDLSIVGFDDIQLARHVTPPLTTMRVDKIGMGRLAAQLLLNRIAYPEMGQVRVVMQPTLVTRHSVLPAR